MDKLRMHTADKNIENYEKLALLFPNAITETIVDGQLVRAIDADVLRQEISATVVEGTAERYQFTWPDKKKALMLANAPLAAALRPCREESVSFDDTENLYIEGDNLDVLKLLREAYLGKVKMIYIDPPYNTGNNHIYHDDFAEAASEFWRRDGQLDEEGNRMVKNLDSNGRFHTDWLNMIYPRLRIAKDLLSDSGVVFISLDDNEVHNQRKLCDEIFGEANFVAQFVWSAGRKNDSKLVSVSHEYMLCYAKSRAYLQENQVIWRERKQGLDEIYAAHNKLTKKFGTDYAAVQRGLREWFKALPKTHPANNHAHYSCVDERGIYFAADISWPGGGGPRYEVLHPTTHKPVKVPARGWMFSSPQSMQEAIDDERVHFGADENSVPCIKSYLKDKEFTVPYSVFYQDGRASTKRLRQLMDADAFENPKDEEVIQSIIEFVGTQDGIILDFFSGSGTTAHATMLQNSVDNGHRKFIMVQIPELCHAKSPAYKAGYNNICELGKERIRRAGARIKGKQPLATVNLDIGFRVLKLDSSNMKDVHYTPDKYEPSLFHELTDNIKEDRTPEDLLFQVMLDLGVLLSSKIRRTEIGGKTVFSVADNFLIACFDNDVGDDVIKEIAGKTPHYAVFRDSSFLSDSAAANFEQIFACYSPSTIRKVL